MYSFKTFYRVTRTTLVNIQQRPVYLKHPASINKTTQKIFKSKPNKYNSMHIYDIFRPLSGWNAIMTVKMAHEQKARRQLIWE